MDLNEASSLARNLMDQHGLASVPFKFDNAKRRFGVCAWTGMGNTWRLEHIALSRIHTAEMPEDDVRDTILHEIAHALSGPRAGHGRLWKANARRIGANPERISDKVGAEVEHKVVGVCPNGHETKQHRLPLRVHSCVKCSRYWSFDYAFTWHKEGSPVPFNKMPERYRQEYNRILARSNRKTN